MVSEYTYSPHVDFYIDMIDREHSYDMGSFHTHHKYELYYEVEGARRYFIEDSAYIVNAGNVILIGENQIHKTGSVGDGPTSRIVCNFSREYLQEISGAFPEIDLFGFMSEENNHPELARKTMETVCRSFGILPGKDFEMDILKRKTPSEMYELMP